MALRKYVAMHARGGQLPRKHAGLLWLFTLPPVLRKSPRVQRWLGIRTRLLEDHAEVSLPGGDILSCGRSWAARHEALRIYLVVSHLGQYLRFGPPGPGDVVLDVGAHLGCFVLSVARLVGPTGHVYACEPMADNLANLRRTIAANNLTNVTVIEKAVGAAEGTTDIAVNPVSAAHSAVLREGAESVSVETTAIDQIVRDYRLTRVDFIKIDVEGMEADVLRGAAQTLRQHRPRLVMAGYHLPEDVRELPRLLGQLAPGYHCEGDPCAWSELDLHAWCEAGAGEPDGTAAERV